MPYGYLGQTPNQQFKNSGVFSVGDAKALTDVGQLGGSLELIQTQTYSSGVSVVDFNSIGSYDVHLFQYSNINEPTTSAGQLGLRFSTDGGSNFATSGYQYAVQYGTVTAAFGENRSASDGQILLESVGASGFEDLNGYCYIYNALTSSKYTFSTMQNINQRTSDPITMRFGSGVQPTAQAVNAFRILSTKGGNFTSFNISLYGVKEL
jgi:hypothetical protein|tara:strand:+ start:593 stop:1216 length:624 start_codon:yes stop_codon:yes gene_type:complete